MRWLILALSLGLLVAACKGSTPTPADDPTTPPAETTPPAGQHDLSSALIYLE